MKLRTFLISAISALLLSGVASAQTQPKFPVDPKTGRAIGAQEASPEEVQRMVESGSKTLIVDVREREDFEKETIQGAINVPLGQLGTWLKGIAKDTRLVFT